MAQELGFETFVVDAMWFPQSGAWYWDPKRFPNGYKPIEEYVHSHGMKFGLWMAYTQGTDSDDPQSAERIKQHPDWFISTPKLDPEGHINWDALIDLGYDPARDWAEQTTQRVVSEYKLDYFKTDYTSHCYPMRANQSSPSLWSGCQLLVHAGLLRGAGGSDAKIP